MLAVPPEASLPLGWDCFVSCMQSSGVLAAGGVGDLQAAASVTMQQTAHIHMYEVAVTIGGSNQYAWRAVPAMFISGAK